MATHEALSAALRRFRFHQFDHEGLLLKAVLDASEAGQPMRLGQALSIFQERMDPVTWARIELVLATRLGMRRRMLRNILQHYRQRTALRVGSWDYMASPL